METGRRVWQCELSTIDSAFLFAGALTVAAYFDRDTADEAEIRSLADMLYRRADWNWARDGGPTLDLRLAAPRPGSSRTIIRATTRDYCSTSSASARPRTPSLRSAIAPTATPASGRPFTAGNSSTRARSSRTSSRTCGSTFAVSVTNSWRSRGSDYFENSRQATLVQQECAVRNPMNFAGYGEHCWGFTACDGCRLVPAAWSTASSASSSTTSRTGAPFGRDDGTVAPWAALASIPFARRSSSRQSAISRGWTWG